MRSFPNRVSLTITNSCNLRCRMCGQWSENGYILANGPGDTMPLSDWKRVVDEMAAHGVSWALIRGGEPFLYPWALELIAYMRSKGLATAIDTNATLLHKYAAELVRIGGVEITVSVDGPEEIHDDVRGVKGCFAQIERGLAALHEAEQAAGAELPCSICFTISSYSYKGLGVMPDVARRLGVKTILIAPYYWTPPAVGKQYEAELRAMGCAAYSWRGFQHETSGVDPDEFQRQLARFKATLGDVKLFPFMDIAGDEYLTWFADATTPVGPTQCWLVDDMVDIQPGGDVNFCVDYPDYVIGNVRTATLEEAWNSEAAARFRNHRQEQPLAVCHRCGAKYMSAPRTADGHVIRA